MAFLAFFNLQQEKINMAKTKSKKIEVESDRDSLADDIADILNKSNKDGGNIAFVLGDDNDDDPTKIIDWVPSGCDQLDVVMTNMPDAGFPVGRITEITGLEAAGKSLLSMHALAETQKKGGLAVFIDTETSLDHEFVEAIGVDLKKMLYISCDHVEEIFDHIETIVQKVRGANKDRLVTIVVDSVAAASCKREQESDHGQDGFATGKAIIISKAMRKITQMIARQRICLVFTNQLRVNIGAMYGDKYTTSGGKGIAFHASLRLRLQAIKRLQVTRAGVKIPVGVKTKCTVMKSRFGTVHKNLEFDIFFDRGIDNYGNWIETLKERKLITQSAPHTYVNDAGDKIKLSKTGEEIEANPELRDELYKKLCDLHIMKYRHQLDSEDEEVEMVDAEE